MKIFCPAITFILLMNSIHAQPATDVIHYTSLNTAIYLGQYDGSVTAAEVKKHGDFGLGSEDRLAGELVMLDGVMYSIPASGKASITEPGKKVPFAAVKFFKAEQTVTVKQALTLKEFEHYLDSLIDKNRFAAIKVTAQFSTIKFRSFYEQQKPYRELEKVPEVVFEHANFEGILVGFYTPKSAEVVNSPVYHFHVIDQKRTTGGHLKECIIKEASIEIDYATQLVVDLPSPDTVSEINLNAEVKKN